MTVCFRNCSCVALVMILGISGAGCRKDPELPARPAAAAGTGTIRGVVKFEGGVSQARQITEAQCHPGAKPVYDDSLVVDADGGLRNVVVYVLDGPNVQLSPAAAVLDQAECQFVPHVLAVRAGQPVTVRSSDPVLHNVHASKPAYNKPFNLAFPIKGQEMSISFARPEASPPIEVRCDVHQWMRAYVAVFDHPFFAVTGEGGKFAIDKLPAGQYTLVIWHEKYGEKRQQVTVGAGESVAEFRVGQ
jgi:plastocyanin